MTALKKWMRKMDIYDVETEAVLIEQGVNDPADFKTYTQAQFDVLWRKCVVQRAKELKDQKAKVRLEKRMKKLEKHWRKESGIKMTSQTKNTKKKKKSKKSSNLAKTKTDALAAKASNLKKYLQKNQCYAGDLLNVCAEHEIFTEEDMNKIVQKTYDDIYRQVRVLRAKELKDQKAKVRMEKLMTKFEKLWRGKTGLKKSSQTKKTKKGNSNSKAPKQQRADELTSGKGQDLKKWLKKNSVWEKELFDQLMSKNIVDEEGLKALTETEFDNIVRQVRVEKFKDVNDAAARNRVDKLLVSFEKIWRSQSGVKKTSIK